MSLSINSNLYSSIISRNLISAYITTERALAKLSSGKRLISASVDPAALVISEQMKARIASLNSEINNVTNKIYKYETASSTIMEMRSILTEINSISISAANTAVNSPEMTAIYQMEADSLVRNYNRLVQESTYNNQNLFDGSQGAVANLESLPNFSFSDRVETEQSINELKQQTEELDLTLASMGATMKNDLESRVSNMRVEVENLTAAESNISDADMFFEFSNFMKGQMQIKCSLAMMAHSAITQQATISLLQA